MLLVLVHLFSDVHGCALIKKIDEDFLHLLGSSGEIRPKFANDKRSSLV
jgi:hypothetical protein